MKKSNIKIVLIIIVLLTSCSSVNYSTDTNISNRYLKFNDKNDTYAIVGTWNILVNEAPDNISQKWIDNDLWVENRFNSSWKSLGVNSTNGMVSYAINLKFDKPQNSLYLYPGETFSAQRIFVKNKLGKYIKVFSNSSDEDFNNFNAGVIGTQIVRLPPLPKETTLVVQISNGLINSGKFDYPVIIGSLMGLSRFHNLKLFWGSIFLGVFFIISVTQLSFGKNRKDEKEYLFIGLLYFAMAVRVFDTFSLIYYLGSGLSVAWLWRIGWFTLYFVIIFWLLMFRNIFNNIGLIFNRVINITLLLFIISGLFSDKILSYTGDITIFVIAPLTIVYSLFTVIKYYVKYRKIEKHMGLWTTIIGITGLIDIVSQIVGVNIDMLNWGLVALGVYLLASHNKKYLKALDYSLTTNRELELMVETRTLELKRANKLLEQECITDALTKLPNRKALYRRFEYEIENMKVNSNSLCLAIIDADFFKSINDRYGHDVGDIVLKSLADTIKDNIRPIDLISRFGGEEFVLLMPTSSVKGAVKSIERLRELVSNSPIFIDDFAIYITISIGITEVSSNETLIVALKRADSALYKAKEYGRDRVVTM